MVKPKTMIGYIVYQIRQVNGNDIMHNKFRKSDHGNDATFAITTVNYLLSSTNPTSLHHLFININ